MSQNNGISYADFLGCCGFSILGAVFLYNGVLFLKLAFFIIVCPVIIWVIASHFREIFQAFLWLARHGWRGARRTATFCWPYLRHAGEVAWRKFRHLGTVCGRHAGHWLNTAWNCAKSKITSSTGTSPEP